MESNDATGLKYGELEPASSVTKGFPPQSHTRALYPIVGISIMVSTMNESQQPAPKAFMSYSWDNEEHKEWVLHLAKRLASNGVDVVLDRWDVRLGSDLFTFMESGLRDTDRVLVVSSDNYIVRANNPTGGVGYEKRIITAQMASDFGTNRVIPLLRSNISSSVVPTFLSSLNYVDFRDDAAFESKYAELIHELHGERMLPRPALGNNPFAPNTSTDVRRAIATDPTRYTAPASEGTVSFNYLNNDGRFTIGTGVQAFTLAFSSAGDGSIYAYTDPPNIEWVALAPQTALEDVVDPWAYDSSSRVRTARVGDTTIWRNTVGRIAAVQIDRVTRRDTHTAEASIEFHYRIAAI